MSSELESRHGPRAEPEDPVSNRMAAVLLGTAVVVAVLAYGVVTGGTKGIWILPDELGYGLLAQSFGATGHFSLRGTSTLTYPVGYPALISPAFIGRGPIAAYDYAKWLNAVMMSLAAIPVFLIARRLVPNRLALVVAGLSLLIPAMAYTRVLLSENAFFPIFMLAILAFVRALELPTTRRQLIALLVIVPVVGVRAEGVITIPILLVAMVIQSLTAADRGTGRYRLESLVELRRFRATWLLLPAALIVLVLAEAALGRSPTAILGRYAGSLRSYPIGPTLRWSLYQLVDLELYVVVIPLLATLLSVFALLRGRETTRAQRAVASVSIPAVVLAVLAAGASSSGSQGGPGHHAPFIPPELHDRYCFFVAPLFFAFLAYWLSHRREFSTRAAIAVGGCLSAVPLVLPYPKVHTSADFDALALLPWSNGAISGRHVHYAMAVLALLLCVVAMPLRKSIVLSQVAIIVGGLLIMETIAAREIADASVRVPSSRLADRSWVDQSVPKSASVALVWKRGPSWSEAKAVRREQAVWRAEMFNPSITSFFYVGSQMDYGLPATKARLEDGRVLAVGEPRFAYRYVLTASPLPLAGVLIARDRRGGLLLYRLSGSSGA